MELLSELSVIGIIIGLILMVGHLDNFIGVKGKKGWILEPTKETRRSALKPFLYGFSLFILSLYLYLT